MDDKNYKNLMVTIKLVKVMFFLFLSSIVIEGTRTPFLFFKYKFKQLKATKSN